MPDSTAQERQQAVREQGSRLHDEIMTKMMQVSGHDEIKRSQITAFMEAMRKISVELVRESKGMQSLTSHAEQAAKALGRTLEMTGIKGDKYPLGSTEPFINAYMYIAREKLHLKQPFTQVG